MSCGAHAQHACQRFKEAPCHRCCAMPCCIMPRCPGTTSLRPMPRKVMPATPRPAHDTPNPIGAHPTTLAWQRCLLPPPRGRQPRRRVQARPQAAPQPALRPPGGPRSLPAVVHLLPCCRPRRLLPPPALLQACQVPAGSRHALQLPGPRGAGAYRGLARHPMAGAVARVLEGWPQAGWPPMDCRQPAGCCLARARLPAGCC